jgi:hypothetical protein
MEGKETPVGLKKMFPDLPDHVLYFMSVLQLCQIAQAEIRIARAEWQELRPGPSSHLWKD